MSIPNDALIQWELLKLLHSAPACGMPTDVVYVDLAKVFPCLSREDRSEPYSADKSGCRWNTAVRSAREKLKVRGYVSRHTERGYWALTEQGHLEVVDPLGGII